MIPIALFAWVVARPCSQLSAPYRPRSPLALHIGRRSASLPAPPLSQLRDPHFTTSPPILCVGSHSSSLPAEGSSWDELASCLILLWDVTMGSACRIRLAIGPGLGLAVHLLGLAVVHLLGLAVHLLGHGLRHRDGLNDLGLAVLLLLHRDGHGGDMRG